MEKWDKQFRPLYTKTKKAQKRISSYVLLVKMLATLTLDVQSKVINKAEFLLIYKFMQIFLDHPEIMQIYQFIKYAKFSYLDLQFILLKDTKEAKIFKK